MSGNLVDISCAASHRAEVEEVCAHPSVRLLSVDTESDRRKRVSLRLYVEEADTQQVVDRIRQTLADDNDAMMILTPASSRISGPDQSSLTPARKRPTREELVDQMILATTFDGQFAILTILATIVAAIGIQTDNTAVVIAAMVIAPLLGPNMGLALGAALGNVRLMQKAFLTNLLGVSITLICAAGLAIIWPPDVSGQEFRSRTSVQVETLILAFASGIAGALSLTTRLSNTLVGVMIAVALVPPATVLGMLLGMQQWNLASGAALLLAMNVIALNVASQLVFLGQGIRPRTSEEQQGASDSTRLNLIVWIALLVLSLLVMRFLLA